MLSTSDKDYIRKQFLTDVTDVDVRSRVMACANALAEGDDDFEDAYLSTIHHLSQPENADELDDMYASLGGPLAAYLPEKEDD